MTRDRAPTAAQSGSDRHGTVVAADEQEELEETEELEEQEETEEEDNVELIVVLSLWLMAKVFLDRSNESLRHHLLHLDHYFHLSMNKHCSSPPMDCSLLLLLLLENLL